MRTNIQGHTFLSLSICGRQLLHIMREQKGVPYIFRCLYRVELRQPKRQRMDVPEQDEHIFPFASGEGACCCCCCSVPRVLRQDGIEGHIQGRARCHAQKHRDDISTMRRATRIASPVERAYTTRG